MSNFIIRLNRILVDASSYAILALCCVEILPVIYRLLGYGIITRGNNGINNDLHFAVMEHSV